MPKLLNPPPLLSKESSFFLSLVPSAGLWAAIFVVVDVIIAALASWGD